MKLEKIREEAYNKVFEIMQIINSEENFTIFNDLDSIQYRIKSEISIKNKMKKVGNNIFNVYDLIGIRYIFNKLEKFEEFKHNLVNNQNFEIVEIRDYLKSGHSEDPDYKALHLRIKYKEYPCEIEIMDTNMSEHVVLTHTSYKKGLLKKD